LPDTDQVVRVSGEKGLAIGGPGKGGARWSLGFGGCGKNLGLQLVDDDLAFQIPDLDGSTSGGAKPVSIGRECESVDGITAIEGVKVLALVEVPQHGLAVLATGSAKRTVGRNGDGVQVSSVANVVGLQLAVGQVPHLNELVPSGGNDDGVGVGGRETDARNPLRVSVFLDGVFADSQSVPQLDGAVAGSGHDLSVIGRESDAENVFGVSDESSGRRSHRQIPQTQGRVPRAGKSKLAVRGQNDVGHKVTMSLQCLVGDAIVGFILGELPDDNRLVPGRGKNHVGEHGGGRNLRHPPIVSLESSTKSQLFRHGLG